MNSEEKVDRTAQLILSYLKKHPEAGDTLEGIAKWWLEMERIETSITEVAAACLLLKQKGLIQIYQTINGQTIYKINKGKRETPLKENGFREID